MPLSYRTVWLSDLHLGNPKSRAGDLLDFLDNLVADQIYLVGDIIDLEYLKARPAFPDAHRQAVCRFIQLANAGTEIIYVPGNHDFEFRELAGRDICGIPVMLETAHETRSGRRLLVTHGDVLDRDIRKGTNLEQFGAAAYGVMLRLDVMINQLRSRLGHDYLSISRRLKERLASANKYIRRFEEVALILILAPIGLWLGTTPVERTLLIGSAIFVLIVELLNSAVEAAIDRHGDELHELSGRAKDLGSAAVMLSLILLATAIHARGTQSLNVGAMPGGLLLAGALPSHRSPVGTGSYGIV